MVVAAARRMVIERVELSIIMIDSGLSAGCVAFLKFKLFLPHEERLCICVEEEEEVVASLLSVFPKASAIPSIDTVTTTEDKIFTWLKTFYVHPSAATSTRLP